MDEDVIRTSADRTAPERKQHISDRTTLGHGTALEVATLLKPLRSAAATSSNRTALGHETVLDDGLPARKKDYSLAQDVRK